jgi:hypothetical protein
MLQRQAVDTAIIALLTGELLKLETLQQILNAIPEADSPEPGVNRRMQVAAKLDQRRARLLDLYEAGDITREEFSARKRTIESERAALQHIPTPLRTVSAKELALALVETFTGFHQLPQDEQRAILQRAVSRIMMSGRTVVSLTLSGGFLGDMVAKLNPRSGRPPAPSGRKGPRDTPDFAATPTPGNPSPLKRGRPALYQRRAHEPPGRVRPAGARVRI